MAVFFFEESAPEPSHGAGWFKVSSNFDRYAQEVQLSLSILPSTLVRFGSEFCHFPNLGLAFFDIHEHLPAVVLGDILETIG